MSLFTGERDLLVQEEEKGMTLIFHSYGWDWA